MITVGSLFAGIGGIDLGLERTGGFKTVWQCEIDDYATKVLAKHWPDVRRWRDVRTFLDEIYRNREQWACDMLAFGDPCQRNSAAGKSTSESLGPYALATVAILRPRFVLRENPSHIRSNAPWPWWRTRAGFESLGYAVVPFRRRACCSGAFHQRERVFLFAELADSGCERLERRQEQTQDRDSGESQGCIYADDWMALSASRGLRSRRGFPGYVERVKGCGNAVYPATAEWIGRRILEAEDRAGDMSEMVFCPSCMEVKLCTIRRECGVVFWTCTVCGCLADEDFELLEPVDLDSEQAEDRTT